VKQVYKVLNDIENLARCTPAKVGKALSGPLLSIARRRTEQSCRWEAAFSALYGMYAVTLNELKTVIKVNTQARQSGAVNEISVESTAQDDDFPETKKRKRHISNNTLQTAKK
jgi:hypothetical protein